MREIHPYGEFIPPKPKCMIIGSFPIGKFTDPDRRHEIKSNEFDFFFGGEKNLLWKLLAEVFEVKLQTRNDIINLLKKKKMAVGDVISSCKRKNKSASDVDLFDMEWNVRLLEIIRKNHIQKVFFTSRKVEQWFNRLFPETPDLEKVTLISPSAQSIRALSQREDYRRWIKRHPKDNKFLFILFDYKKKFKTIA